MAALGAAQGKRPLRKGGAGGRYLTGPNLWTMENWRTDLLEVRTKGRVGGGQAQLCLLLPPVNPCSITIDLPSQQAPPLRPGCASLGWRPYLGCDSQEIGGSTPEGWEAGLLWGEESEGAQSLLQQAIGKKPFGED